MCATRGNSVSADGCDHANTIINREDESVCTACGLVVFVQLFSSFLRETPYFKPFNKTHEFMKDVGENAFISDAVITQAINYYDKLSLLFKKKIREETLAAYSIYETLNKHEVPRLAREISYFSGVSESEIWRVEANLTLEIPLSSPQQYVQRYCNLLNLGFKAQEEIIGTVETMQQLPLGYLRSNCLVAVGILLCCKKNKKRLTLKKICESCNISATSVHRVKRQLQKLKSEVVKIPSLKWMERFV